MPKKEDILTALDELTTKGVRSTPDQETILDTIEFIESQASQIEALEQNLEISREVWRKEQELMTELQSKIARMMDTLNNLT